MNPSAETCVGIIMIARMNVKIAFLPLKSYEWIAYAVMTEKYVHRAAVQAEMMTELRRPESIGCELCSMLFRFSIRCVLGIAVNPRPSSPFDLVALMNNT